MSNKSLQVGLLSNEESLMNHLSKEKWSLIFLRICVLCWPLTKDEKDTSTKHIMKVCAIIGFFLIGVACILIWVSSIAIMIIDSGGLVFWFVLLELISSFFMEISSFANIYYCRIRLMLPPVEVDMPHYLAGAKISAWYLIFFLLLMLAASILFCGSGSPLNSLVIILLVIQWVMSVGLALSLFFVIVDCRTCRSILQDLSVLVDMELLTMDKLEEAKATIQERVNYYPVVNAFIAAIAGFNSLVFLLLILFLRIIVADHQFSLLAKESLSFSGGEALSAFALLSKEVVYLGLVLREIASVNDQSDMLVKRLTTKCWVDCKEVLRLRLFVNLYGEPITFPLCGLRPTGTVVYWQVAIYLLSLAISLLQLIFAGQLADLAGRDIAH